VQAPVVSGITDVKTLAGKRIVTSFPNLAKEFFSKFEDPANPTSVKYVSGSVEAACGLGLADAVVDLVETGTTMRAAGLEIVSNVMDTEAVLISNPKNSHQDLVDKLNKRIEGHLAAARYNMINYNIERSQLRDAFQITPGKRSPTVSPLEDPAWVAVAAMIEKKKTSDIMDELERLGATDILVFAIDNCRV
jgi:ATP phosphoribosyltransferase